MGKDVGGLIVSVSCGRRLRSGLPLSVVLFHTGWRSCLAAQETGRGGREDTQVLLTRWPEVSEDGTSAPMSSHTEPDLS